MMKTLQSISEARMSFFKKLFGGREAEDSPKNDPIEYNGFLIYPEPIKVGSTYRVAARIEKVIDNACKTQTLIRADTISDPDKAGEMATIKARQVIDERGEKLFEMAQV
ncbi:HlyU family transcriptional regulator [Shimia thalassica]|uniref:HlyU family transcriptional regulator n=1 Tax=Shimia thalassica TaxID=1715693 RepID=UPI0020907846|nr:HlyU family transcriptional regulator [Shimia thalassica]MDO6478343.1 HlyU family transcriptional regulator [Shimia thalassica]MDO6502887.1 HlyU family transcriptional regulator [Shimia thalassica]